MASRNPRKQRAIRQAGDQGTGLYDALVQATNTPLTTRLPVRPIALADIIQDADVQVRVQGLDMEKVEEYRIRVEHDSEAPPIDVFTMPNGKYLLAAGFHRVEAYRLAGRSTIEATIRQGDVRDARELAEQDNLNHGLPYTLADKKNIYQRRLLDGRTWFGLENGEIKQKVSDREIARDLGVSPMAIGRWKKELTTVTGVTVDASKVVSADGKVRDVSQIRQTAAKRFEDFRSEEKKSEVAEASREQVDFDDDPFADGAEFVPGSAYYESNPPSFESREERATLAPAAIEPTPNPFAHGEFSPQKIAAMYKTMVLKVEELEKLYEQLSQIRGLEYFQDVMGQENVDKMGRVLQRGLQTTHALDELLNDYLQKI